jgi:FkbM family methyltransferase
MNTIKTKQCRHGLFSFYENDMYVGKSLANYGEFSPDEVSVFDMVLRPDDVAIEVGSNIGALTVPLAQRCKKLYAFEPHPENMTLLRTNIDQNDLTNVKTFMVAIGDHDGHISLPTLDDLGNIDIERDNKGKAYTISLHRLDDYYWEEKIKFIKIDAEGSELDILKGASGLIARDRPIMYIENDRKEKSPELVGWLIDNGYTMYWHRPPLFYGGNFANNPRNVFGNTVSISMVCVANESGIKVDSLEEVSDQRVDSEMYNRECNRMLAKVARDPTDVESRFKAAHYHNLMGRTEDARALIAENLQYAPDNHGTLAMRGLLDLQDGNFELGWQAYELRYKQKAAVGFGFRPHDVPHWDGKPTDKTVLIWCEQGFGDSIMFARYMDIVLDLAPNAILEIQPQLFELFELSRVVPEGCLFRLGRALPDYDFHCSLPSIPATLGMKDIGKTYNAYLKPDPKMVAHWTKSPTPMPKIGICTRGGVASERAYSRDMPIELGDALADKFGPFMSLANDGQWESYADTAAAISSLDIVLTVDTSVAHLSGALGAPTILMLSSDPDWRWQRERSDSPWYPSMTIIRQKHFMDWSNVIEGVSEILEKLEQQKAA